MTIESLSVQTWLSAHSPQKIPGPTGKKTLKTGKPLPSPEVPATLGDRTVPFGLSWSGIYRMGSISPSASRRARPQLSNPHGLCEK